MSEHQFRLYREYQRLSPEKMHQRSADFLSEMQRRRTVRDFADKAVPRAVIENCLRTAGTAPSGAHLQPWQFLAISDQATKEQIFHHAEEVERDFYRGEATRQWVQDLEPLGTGEHKPFLHQAPWLLVVFAKRHGLNPDGTLKKHYYVNESVGIACGFLIAALHRAGLVSLTYTPSKSKFLNRLLQRPENERPYMIVVTGHPAKSAQVPVLERKALNELAEFI